MTSIHPELQRIARVVPRRGVTPRNLAFVRRMSALAGRPVAMSTRGVVTCDVMVPGPTGAPDVRVRLYRPAGSTEPVPALLWIHGGGFLIGTARQDERSNIDMVRQLGIAVASVDYRLAPEHPFPAPAEDCYAALRWVHAAAPAFGIRSDRIAVGGASAGGGLAAGVALMAHDRGEVPLAFQLLVYPMLDDRTVQRARGDESDFRLWNSSCNEFGWRSYLGATPGGPDVSPYAAPARRVDLGGLAPAWLGVGTLDLFHDEDVDYANRLREAGVACDLVEVDGAFHGFDGLAPRARVVTAFRRSWFDALGGVLNS